MENGCKLQMSSIEFMALQMVNSAADQPHLDLAELQTLHGSDRHLQITVHADSP